MIASVEQRIRQLEDQMRSLKCAYLSSSSMLRLSITESPEIEVYSNSAIGPTIQTLKFTPNKGGDCFMSFRTETETLWEGEVVTDGSRRYYPKTFAQVTNSSDGIATIRISVAGMRVKIKIIATGTCSGTFTEVS